MEGTRFTVRTDHDALRWLMSLTETSGRLTGWRLRLAEYDFETLYRPVRVLQVLDAMSRLVQPSDPLRPQKPVDDDVPTLEPVTQPSKLILVTTRRLARGTTTPDSNGGSPAGDTDETPTQP